MARLEIIAPILISFLKEGLEIPYFGVTLIWGRIHIVKII